MNKRELVSNLHVEIKPLEEKDVQQFDDILRQHIRDRVTGEIVESEVRSVKRYMGGDVDEHGRKRRYLVAKTGDGRVIGCMSCSTPDPDMVKHFSDIDPNDSCELLNAFVDSTFFRGGGVGKKLLGGICDLARSEGKKYLLIHSGPRYKLSWGFYDKMTDESRGYIVEKYGHGGDAMTWIKKL